MDRKKEITSIIKENMIFSPLYPPGSCLKKLTSYNSKLKGRVVQHEMLIKQNVMISKSEKPIIYNRKQNSYKMF